MKTFTDVKSNMDQMIRFVSKTWEKKNMLVTSIFSFSCSVFFGFFLSVANTWDCVVKQPLLPYWGLYLPTILKNIIYLIL